MKRVAFLTCSVGLLCAVFMLPVLMLGGCGAEGGSSVNCHEECYSTGLPPSSGLDRQCTNVCNSD